MQAAEHTNVVQFPEKPQRVAHKPWAPDDQAEGLGAEPVTALMLALLSALSIGNKRDRAIFGLVKWEIARGATSRPDDANLSIAADVLRAIEGANHGR